LDVSEEFDLDDNFRWDGDESGAEYVDHSPKSNKSATLCPSCCSVAVPLLPHLNPSALPTAAPNSMTVPSSSPNDEPTTNRIISLLHCLHRLIQRVSHSSIGVFLSKRFAVADTRATNHMLPEKAAFISYNLISNLQVCMENNSFIMVLGCGTTVISLNG
jgi:hypothetical protein